MISVCDLFESHLTVANLERSMTFFNHILGLELAEVFLDRRVAFYWIGGRGQSPRFERASYIVPPAECIF